MMNVGHENAAFKEIVAEEVDKAIADKEKESAKSKRVAKNTKREAKRAKKEAVNEDRELVAAKEEAERQIAAAKEEAERQIAAAKEEAAAAKEEAAAAKEEAANKDRQIAAVKEEAERQIAANNHDIAEIKKEAKRAKKEAKRAKKEAKRAKKEAKRTKKEAANKDRELVAAKEEAANKDRQIAAVKEEAERQIAAKNHDIAEVKRVAKSEAKQDSLKRSVLAILQGSPFPSLQQVECVGTTSSHLYPKKAAAYFVQREFIVHDIYSIAAQEKFRLMDVTSKAADMIFEKKKYYNESDLRLCVNFVLYDTLSICNSIIAVTADERQLSTPFKLELRTESSMFTNIIDHVVVYDSKSNLPLFAVESKKHLPSEFDSESEYKVWGQCYDQLQDMKLAGHPSPFGVLTSFNSTIVTWLDTDTHNTVLSYHVEGGLSDDRISKIIADLPKLPSFGSSISSLSPPGKCNSEEATQSTDNSSYVLRSPASEDGTVTRRSFESDGRIIVTSTEHFQQDSFVDVLVNVIFCSMDGVHQPRSIVQDLKVGENVTADHACCLKVGADKKEKQYEWVDVSTRYKGPLSTTIYGSLNIGERDYYLISYLGRGRTSKVYRAITKSGYDCVVKMYVQNRAADNSVMTAKDFKKFSHDMAKQERDNFHYIYSKSKIRKYVWMEKLNGLFCIIMPFFEPIKKSERASKETIDKIAVQLKNFCKAKKKFKKCDQVWKHVGSFQDEIFLFDLGELLDIEDQEEEGMIDIHMKRLDEIK